MRNNSMTKIPVNAYQSSEYASSDFHQHSFAVSAPATSLPGTIYLLPSIILSPWALSKLLWEHTSSTPPTRHATDSHLSAPQIQSFMTYGANQRNICDWLIDWIGFAQSNGGCKSVDFVVCYIIVQNDWRDVGGLQVAMPSNCHIF